VATEGTSNSEVKKVETCDELKAEIPKAESARHKQYLIGRSVDLGCVEHIPDDWAVEVNGNG